MLLWKCDIVHPTCGRCARIGKTCSFLHLQAASPSTSNLPAPHESPSSVLSIPSFANLCVNKSDTSPAPEPRCHHSAEVDSLLWGDLELMHHYLTSTYMTLGWRDDLQDMWKMTIPKLAMRHKFLMHNLLSVAALHIASLSSSSSLSSSISNPAETRATQSTYISLAIHHHNIALRDYSSRLQNITRENGASLFTCAALIVISSFSLAILRPQHDQETTLSKKGPVEDFCGLSVLLRGTKLVLGEMWDWVRQSEVGPIIMGQNSYHGVVLSDDIVAALGQLRERNELLLNHQSGRDKEAYTLAIDGLADCFQLISPQNAHKGTVLKWPIIVRQEFLALLGERQPMALVILAHYGVILHEIRDVWWVMGWGGQLIKEINRLVDDEWRSLVAWPMIRISVGT